jgi:hypothetical protein
MGMRFLCIDVWWKFGRVALGINIMINESYCAHRLKSWINLCRWCQPPVDDPKQTASPKG